jgi:hypothetical protein
MEQSLKDLREGLVNFLLSEAITVTFTKANGEVRNMKCTLKPSLINDTYEKKTDRNREKNEEVLSVWDCDKQAWRSFRLDSVKSFTLSLGE